MILYCSTIPSPIGTLWAGATCTHLKFLAFEKNVFRSPSRSNCSLIFDRYNPIIELLKGQLCEYFARNRKYFDLPIEPEGTEFQKKSWNTLCKIPYGEKWVYSKQAKEIGHPNAIRAIGGANSKNPISIVIPCHRVVPKSGGFGGFAGGTQVKKILLLHEAGLGPRFASMSV